jgi:FAD/FMN-containing dehydrogenase
MYVTQKNNRKLLSEETMDETEIKSMLDTLSNWQARRDLLEADKRALLDDVKIPAEVEAIVSAGMKQMSEVEGSFNPTLKTLREVTEAKLALIVIPEEIKSALAEIDRQRAAIRTHQSDQENEISQRIRTIKAEVQAEVEDKTKGIYTAIAQRRAEIEAEFSGKEEAVDDNIRKLTEEIKAEIVTLKKSVKGEHYHGIYVTGRITWNTDMMEGWRETFPFLEKARKEGAPSVTLRRI